MHLTYRGSNEHSPDDGPTLAEIAVTPEMIDAGVSALVVGMAPATLYPPMTEAELAKQVFEAMVAAAVWE